jgi:hypothetical protein
MADEIATFAFPGIEAVESADYTLAHGRTPGVCTIRCRPQRALPSLLPSTLTIRQFSKLDLPDCIIDQGEIISDGSGQIVQVRILDRRWKWQFPTISGRYNRYDENGNLDVATEKAPQELAKLCLEAMGETNFLVDQMPNDIRPFVDWDYSNAAEALESLAEACGCRIAYCADNYVRIVRVGIGRSLDLNDPVTERIVQITDTVAGPDRLVFAGGPDIFQADLELEAVGRDLSGDRIKLLADLSYKPAADWDAADLDFLNEISDVKLRELALSSVFKLYRIKIPENGLTVPGHDKRVTSLAQLELLGVQVVTETVNGVEQPKEPLVYGKWCNDRDDNANSISGSITPISSDPSTDAEKSAIYPYEFSINTKDGTVQFGSLVYKQTEDTDKMKFEAADIRLRIALYIRDEKTGAYLYTTKGKATGYANGTKPRIVRESHLSRKRYPEYAGSFDVFAVIDNKPEFDRDAQEYLDSAHTEYQRKEPQTVTHGGLWVRLFDLDGAIQQITWTVPGGNAHATTTIYRNNDYSDVLPTYAQMRYRRRLQGGLETLKRLAGAVGDAAGTIGRTIFGGSR